MAVFNGSAQRVQVGPGTLYAAPLGTQEPTSLTGAWPAGWVLIGYTDKGMTRSQKPTVNPVEVDEEYDAVRTQIEGYADSVAFAMAELTAQNRLLAYNAGVGTSLLSYAKTVNPDGSLSLVRARPGDEVHIMLGWDFIPKGGTTGPVLGRSIFRECVQSADTQEKHQKGGANKALFNVEYTVMLPSSGAIDPIVDIVPGSIAS